MNATNDGNSTPRGDGQPEHSKVTDPGPESLAAILTNLGREIRQPLSMLREGICQLVGSTTEAISEAERNQARTLLGVCDDLGRLTRECLGGDGPGPC